MINYILIYWKLFANSQLIYIIIHIDKSSEEGNTQFESDKNIDLEYSRNYDTEGVDDGNNFFEGGDDEDPLRKILSFSLN